VTEHQTLVYRFRLRDKHGSELRRQARAVNFVWNHCQDAQRNALRWGKKWPTGYDLQHLCAGSSKELGLLSGTIDMVCRQYAQSRNQQHKATLRWRGQKSLGWIPLRDGDIRFDGVGFVMLGKRLEAWVTRPLEVGRRFGSGSLSQDARGRWYINLNVKVAPAAAAGSSAVGIDLGLKDLATLSTGEKVAAPRWFRNQQARIATAQRANKKRQVRSLRARVANRRADHLHKLSTRLAQEHGAIFVGNVEPSKLGRTAMAKSIYDAGWSTLRHHLAYKAIRHGVLFDVVDEKWTTQTCNACGVIAGPKGRAGLNKRVWTCGCGASHDRDVNAARNILARGLASLGEGAASCSGVANQEGAPGAQPPP
jgi:putative transposase